MVKLSEEERILRRKNIVKQRQVRHRRMSFELLAKFKDSGCVVCGERELCCLDCHHLNPKEKEFTLGKLSRIRLSKENIIKELQKCICVCRNCHAKIHSNLINIDAAIKQDIPGK